MKAVHFSFIFTGDTVFFFYHPATGNVTNVIFLMLLYHPFIQLCHLIHTSNKGTIQNIVFVKKVKEVR